MINMNKYRSVQKFLSKCRLEALKNGIKLQTNRVYLPKNVHEVIKEKYGYAYGYYSCSYSGGCRGCDS